MVERFVIQNYIGGGKTFSMMTEVHDLYLTDHKEDVLLVFPDHEYLYFWTRMWRDRFAATPFPHYVVGDNYLPIRGRAYRYLFIDNVDAWEDGIYTEKFFELNALWPEQITYSATTSIQSAHNDYVPTHQRAGTNSLLQARLRKKIDNTVGGTD